MNETLNISEIFYTIQGEGPSAGTPALFIRLNGCNLRCSFCDSDYTWLYSERTLEDVKSRSQDDLIKLQVHDKEEEKNNTPIQDLYQSIKNHIIQKNCKLVVITGGEPLLHQKRLAKLFELFDYQELKELKIEIETNGTVLVTQPKLLMTPQINFVVSPKLKSSHNKYERRFKPRVIRNLYEFGSHFKFVIRDLNDIYEVNRITDYFSIREDFERSRVWLMPEGQTSEELATISKEVVELCKDYGYNYSHRIHIEVYGDERGK